MMKKLFQGTVEFFLSNLWIFFIAYLTMLIAQTRFVFGPFSVLGIMCMILAIFFEYLVISLSIDFVAKYIYKNVPYYNEKIRPSYSLTSEIYGYTTYLFRWAVPVAVFYYFWSKALVPTSKLPTLSELPVLAIKIQCALIFADLFYWTWHSAQHKFPFLYKYTNHRYHHSYRFPKAGHGTWLGFIDLFISSSLIGSKNLLIVCLLFGRITEFECLLMLAYVHEMNCVDHCGKKVPFWSGFPLCPPLGYLFKLDHSIPIHEAHHNNNRYSYGLLGIANRIFGTAKYPKTYDEITDLRNKEGNQETTEFAKS